MNKAPVILYVEDEARSRRVMQMIASLNNLPNVIIFEDSTNFLERVLALEPQPEVIFLDIHVPPYNGFEMLHMLRQQEQYRHVPIVAMTASVMNEEVDQLRTAGFDGCLAKPLDMEAFPELLVHIQQGETVWNILVR